MWIVWQLNRMQNMINTNCTVVYNGVPICSDSSPVHWTLRTNTGTITLQVKHDRIQVTEFTTILPRILERPLNVEWKYDKDSTENVDKQTKCLENLMELIQNKIIVIKLWTHQIWKWLAYSVLNNLEKMKV